MAVRVLVDLPQAGFPAASYKGYPAQTVSLRGISLLVGHKRDGLAPAVWLSMRSAAVSVLSGCVHRSCADVVYFLPVLQMVLPQSPLRFAGHRCVGPALAVRVSVCSAAALYLAGYAARLLVLAVIPAHGAGRIAPAAHLRKNLLILCGLGAGSHDAVAGQLHGRFRGQSFRPVQSLCVPRCPSGLAASRCCPTLLQISVPSAAAQWMQLDVSAACLSGGRFVLECLEWCSPTKCVSR